MTRTAIEPQSPSLTAAGDRWVVEVPVADALSVREPSPRTFGRALFNRVQRYCFHREAEARRFLSIFTRPARGQLAFR